MELLPCIFVFDKIRYIRAVSVCLINYRHILAISQIITCSRKERSYGIYIAPAVIVAVIKCQGYKEPRPVHIFVILSELSSSVPHHCPEVLLKRLVSLIITPRFVLGIILILTGQG